MAKVSIVTDSTAYIPKEDVDKFQIRVIPLHLHWGEETFLDGVDIQPEEFYNRLKQSNINPTTSQPTPAAFKDVFESLLERDHEIINILISSKLSGTVDSAIQAKSFFPDAPIEIVDSQSAAMAMGFQVLAVARAAADGASLDECKSLAEKAITHTGVVFAVDTLEFLHRGGRIGGGARFLGTALKMKPILELKEGRVESVERVRTRKKSLDRLVELVVERVGGRTPVRLAALHAAAPDDARWLMEQLSQRLNPTEMAFSEVSPVIGTHAGPGTVAVAYMAGM
jgi:DegV family protein with EDD domain